MPLGGSVDRNNIRNGVIRISDKTEFLEAADPGQALLKFFDQLGAKASPEVDRCSAVRGLPLLLISQLPRSGGSLLSQLFDGHPQLLVHPWEVTIGYPVKSDWPTLDMCDTPDCLFAKLFDARLGYLARKGYRKTGKAKQKQKRLSFNYSPLEHSSFVGSLTDRRTRRTVLDAYFDTFFRAWHSELRDAVFVAGFVPTLAIHRESVAGFFEDYPDGRLISIIRDPADWLASRRAHTKQGVVRFDDVGKEMGLWGQMAGNALRYQRLYGERFLLLSFKELVADREGTMRRICAWSGIDFDPSLLDQTFDGRPISPNTNFDDSPERLADAVLDRKERLADVERERAYRLTDGWRKQLQQAGWMG